MLRDPIGCNPNSDTVDGRNPANHLVCIKPWKSWDKLHINWVAGFLPSTVPLFYTYIQLNPSFKLGRMVFSMENTRTTKLDSLLKTHNNEPEATVISQLGGSSQLVGD